MSSANIWLSFIKQEEREEVQRSWNEDTGSISERGKGLGSGFWSSLHLLDLVAEKEEDEQYSST